MRKEINEQLTICAMRAAEQHLVSNNGVQLPTQYAKTAEMGPMILRSGLLPAVSNYEEKRPAFSPQKADEYKKACDAAEKEKFHVNDAIYATLESFVQCPGIKDLWAPDETLKAKINALHSISAPNKLLQLVSGLTDVGEYLLVREYVLQTIALLKLTLNTFPDKENKGADKQ